MKKEAIFILALVLLATLVSAQSDIEVSSVLLKGTVKVEEAITKSLNVESATGGDFEVSVLSLDNVGISEPKFFLPAGGKRGIDIVFSGVGQEPGIYVGSLQIDSPIDSVQIPLIAEVESTNVFFDSNIDIPPIYAEISRGSKMVYQVKIFDLTSGGGIQAGLGPENVEVEYTVSDLSGNVLITRSEEIVVDGQAQTTNTITFPPNVLPGTYVLSAKVIFGQSVGVSSQTFEITETVESTGSSIAFDDLVLTIMIGVAVLLFLGVVFMFVYLIHERNVILLDLKRYNEIEIRRVKALLRKQEEKLKGRRFGSIDEKRLRKEIDEKLKKVRAKQAIRVKEIKHLKESGSSVEKMKKKLSEWKAEGYKLSPMEYKVDDLTTNEMKDIMKNWKKKYTTTPVKKPKSIKSKKSSHR